MKTLTVTLHHSTNYGATLQAYALQQTILNLGHENVILEYPYKKSNTAKTKSVKAMVRKTYLRCLKCVRGNRNRRLVNSFAEFHKKHMHLTRIYESMEDLRRDPPVADAYITGSDQVWNLSRTNEFTPARFLDFGDTGIKRFSYAASIESLTYTEAEKKTVEKYLSVFSGISLREKSACDYIRGFTGRDAIQVVDPVFLLNQEQWGKMAGESRIKGPFILTYQVLRNERMQEVVDYIRKKTGYPVVQICNTTVKWIKADKTLYDVSPQELISLYINSAIVVSASFHGTALGLVFGKPTYGLVRNEFGNRIKEVLDAFSLGDYCIGPTSPVPEPDIDTSALQEKVKKERERALAFLGNQLS